MKRTKVKGSYPVFLSWALCVWYLNFMAFTMLSAWATIAYEGEDLIKSTLDSVEVKTYPEYQQNIEAFKQLERSIIFYFYIEIQNI